MEARTLATMDLDEDVKQGEDLRLTNLLHKLSCADNLVPNKAEIKAEIVSAVEEHGAPPPRLPFR